MIFRVRVTLEETCVLSGNEEQCVGMRDLHLYLPKLRMLLFLRKSLGLHYFLFASLGRRKKNDAELNSGEHFLSRNFS